MGCTQAMLKVFKEITVEPVLFLYMFGTYMQYVAFQDLVYNKVCSSKFDKHSCDNLYDPSNKDELDTVQNESSAWILWSTIALSVPSIFSSAYIGSWSDRYSRKLPLILPPLGNVFGSLVYIIMSTFQNAPISLIILSSFLSGVLGGFVSCIMSVMAYISAITEKQERTVRIGVLESMSFLGGTFGPFLGSLLMRVGGHSYVFLTILTVNCFIIIYVIAVLDELQEEKLEQMGGGNCCTRVFTLHHMLQAFAVFCKPREGLQRLHLWLVSIAAVVIMVSIAGEMDVAYLFAKDKPLQWDFSLYNYYFAVKYALEAVGLLVLLPILKYRFALRDTTLCLLGLISKTASLVLLGFSYTTVIMFMAPIAGMLEISVTTIRSFISKLVLPQEQGKAFALFGCIQNICSLLGSLVFNSLYPHTRNFFHGFVFLYAAATMLIPTVIVGVVHLQGHHLYEEPNDAGVVKLEDEEEIRCDTVVPTSNSSVPGPSERESVFTMSVTSQERRSPTDYHRLLENA